MNIVIATLGVIKINGLDGIRLWEIQYFIMSNYVQVVFNLCFAANYKFITVCVLLAMEKGKFSEL